MTEPADRQYDWGTGQLIFDAHGRLRLFTVRAHDGSFAEDFARSPDGDESWVTRDGEELRTKYSPESAANDAQEMKAAAHLQDFLNQTRGARVWDHLSKADESIDPATDAILEATAYGHRLLIQIVRADIDTERWRFSSVANEPDQFVGEKGLSVTQAAKRLIDAIELKARRYPPEVRKERVLLLDAWCVPEANDATVQEQVRSSVRGTGFIAIFVAGSNGSQVSQLAGEEIGQRYST